MKTKLLILLIVFGINSLSFSQNNFTIQECVDYALKNHSKIKNAELEVEIAKAKIGETRSIGLPQVDSKWEVMHNIKIQNQFLPAFFVNPAAPADQLIPIAFGAENSSNASITATQLIFDGSYIMGLKAAKTYKDLFVKSSSKVKTDLVVDVKKAYYMALITNERKLQLEENEKLLTKMLEDMKILTEEGMVDQLESKRTKVNLNNLKVEIQNLKSLEEITKNLLKFQMGMNLEETLKLKDDLKTIANIPSKSEEKASYKNNIDYQTLEIQQELNTINLKNEKIRFLPSVGAFLNIGANYGTNSFGDVFKFGDYRGYSMLGASISLPIFGSGQQMYRVRQAKFELQKTENTMGMLKQSIDLQTAQSKTNLNNNVTVLEAQKENKELAQEVFNSTKTKFEAGVASNFEVLSSQTDLKTAQTNYYNALYEVLVAKIELDNVLGNTIVE